jgi:hypothetical protein
MPTLTGGRVRLEPMHAGHVDGLVRAATENRRTYGFTDVPATPEAMARYVATAVAERERGLAVPFVLRERPAGPGTAGTGGADSGSADSGSAGRIVGATRFLDLGFWRPATSPAGADPTDGAERTTSFHWATASDGSTAAHTSTTTTTTTTTVTSTTPAGGAAAARPAGTPASSGELPSVAEIGWTWLAASAQRTAVNTEAKLLLLGHAFDAWAALRVCLKTDARNARSRTAIERLGARFEGIRRAHVLASDGTARDSAYYSIVRAEWPVVRATLIARLTRP